MNAITRPHNYALDPFAERFVLGLFAAWAIELTAGVAIGVVLALAWLT